MMFCKLQIYYISRVFAKVVENYKDPVNKKKTAQKMADDKLSNFDAIKVMTHVIRSG